jgi:hypothetical protein
VACRPCHNGLMPLYLVLRHPSGRQTEKNDWDPEGRLVNSIVTNNDVATLCNVSQIAKEYVYIHRCPWGSSVPEITCRARVASVTRMRRAFKVEFASPEAAAFSPPVQPLRGQEYYFDVPLRGR